MILTGPLGRTVLIKAGSMLFQNYSVVPVELIPEHLLEVQ
jgi:hypothetical protein